MTDSAFHGLSKQALDDLAVAIEQGRVGLPAGPSSLRGQVPAAARAAVAGALEELVDLGLGSAAVARVLRLLAAERAGAQATADRVSIVWSGTEGVGTRSRDTWIVVRDLFLKAARTVLISSYAIDKGDKAEELFGELAARMDAEPKLRVRIFLNVPRKYGDDTPADELLARFRDDFRGHIWPGTRLPTVLHDPRSLSTDWGPKACLHAKCIVADGARAFVSSANFTEAAQRRNIEAGVLLEDAGLASALEEQFEGLVRRALLVPVPGLE